MKKKFVQFVAFLLVVALLPVIPASANPGMEGDTIMRIGLCYGGSAMEGANLLNSTGTGYRFGYYDANNFFVELASTTEQSISMVKTANVGYTSNPETKYHNYLSALANTASVVVGCYHVQLPGSYASFYDAWGIAAQYNGGFVACIAGQYFVRVGNFPVRSGAEALQATMPGTTIVGTSSYGVNVVVTGTNNILFQYDDLGAGTGLGVLPGQMGEMENPTTWFKGNRWYGGFRFQRVEGGNLTIVNVVSMNDYINCVISCEMDNSWPVEALKAQAICARSYAATRTGHSSGGFDLCNTVHCQAYTGMSRTGTNTAQAAAETAGQYAWYNGNIVEAVYHSSDGGATENCENVWYEALPYLRGVIDPYEALVEDKIPNYHWTKAYTGQELQYRLSLDDISCAEIVDVRVTGITETGNVYEVTLTDRTGKVIVLRKDDVRTVLGLSSLRFTIGGSGEDYYLADGSSIGSQSQVWVLDGNGNLVPMMISTAYAITGNGIEAVTKTEDTTANNGMFTFTGTGKGHNLGMSQWGAYAMALQGYTYIDILKFYYTGIEIY